MKNLLVLGLVAVALIFSACNKNSSINAPAGDNSATFFKAADQMNLTNDQLAVVDEMYYMGEDMSILLSPAQLNSYTIVLGKLEPTVMGGDPTLTPRGFADMAAIQFYNLILKANPTLDQTTKDALKQLLQGDAQKRAEIIKNNQSDPATMKQLLQEEHDSLMAAMNALLTDEQRQAVTDLQAKIDQQRQAMRDKLLETRITAQVQMLTKIVGLSTDQAAKVHEILKGQAAKIEALRLQYKGDPEGFRLAVQALQKGTDAEIYANLTPDQQAKWDAWKKGGVIKPRIDPIQAQVDQLTKILNLSADQAAKVKIILQTQADKQKSIMEQFKNDRKGMDEALKQLQKDIDAMIAAELNADQLIIWNKMHGKVDPGNGGDPIQLRVDELTKMLNLSTDQAGKVKIILQTQADKQKAIMEQFKNDPRGLKEALNQLQKDIDAMIAAELNADQLIIWNKMHGKVDPGTGGDPIQLRVDELTKMLGLTPDQAKQIYPILKLQDEETQKILQQYQNDPVGLKQALTDEQAKISKLMQSVLTPDQYARWLVMGGGRNG